MWTLINASTSKLVYDYISGFHRENENGSTILENGRLALFRNYDEHGNPVPRPRTLSITAHAGLTLLLVSPVFILVR